MTGTFLTHDRSSSSYIPTRWQLHSLPRKTRLHFKYLCFILKSKSNILYLSIFTCLSFPNTNIFEVYSHCPHILNVHLLPSSLLRTYLEVMWLQLPQVEILNSSAYLLLTGSVGFFLLPLPFRELVLHEEGTQE